MYYGYLVIICIQIALYNVAVFITAYVSNHLRTVFDDNFRYQIFTRTHLRLACVYKIFDGRAIYQQAFVDITIACRPLRRCRP